MAYCDTDTLCTVFLSEAELALRDHFGRKVHVSGTKRRGMLEIEFYGEEDLQDLVKKFM